MHTQSPFSLKPLCLAAMLFAAAGAHAEITVYTDQAAFLAAVSMPGVDTFDDLAPGPYGDTVYRTAGAYDYQAYSANGLWGVGTTADHWLSNNTSYHPIVFSGFSGNVSAFGGFFFPSDIAGEYVPDGTVVLTAVDGGVLTYDLAGATTNSFLGFVSTSPLSSVSLGTDGGAYWPTANDVVLAVPEPATYAMMLTGIVLVSVAARRRR